MKLKFEAIAFAVIMLFALPLQAQFNLKRAASSVSKGIKAATLTDAEMAEYVKESVAWMDKNNPVLPEDDPYTLQFHSWSEDFSWKSMTP